MNQTQELAGGGSELRTMDRNMDSARRIVELETAASHHQDVVRVMSDKLNRMAERVTQLKEANTRLHQQVRQQKLVQRILWILLLGSVIANVFLFMGLPGL